MARKKITKTLPPDPENMNADRASWAEAAIRTFMRKTGADRCDALGDLLADLMHWADRNDAEATGDPEMQGFDQALDRARSHYAEETMGSDDTEEDPGPVASDPVRRMYAEAFEGETENDRAKNAPVDDSHDCSKCNGLDPVQAARHFMDKSDDPGHGPDSPCEVCTFHLRHG